ncbi:hypothetical protein ACWEGE_38405 [Amycolatopsis sp. NPDC004747]
MSKKALRMARMGVALATLTATVVAQLAPAEASATGSTPLASGDPGNSAASTAVDRGLDATATLAVATQYPIYQCPATNCNQGYVTAGQPVHVYCQTSVWYLVYNPANEHVGFLHTDYINPGPEPSCAGVGTGTSVDNRETIYQCPQTFCNPGQVYPGNDIAQICHAKNSVWTFVLNHANGHVGFINANKLNDLGAWGAC